MRNYTGNEFMYLESIKFQDELFHVFVNLTDDITIGSIIMPPEDGDNRKYYGKINDKTVIVRKNIIIVNKEIVLNKLTLLLNFVVFHEIGHHVYKKYVEDIKCFHYNSNRCIINELFCDMYSLHETKFTDKEINILKNQLYEIFNILGSPLDKEFRYRMSMWSKRKSINIYNLPDVHERLLYNQRLYRYHIEDKSSRINRLYNPYYANDLIRIYNDIWEHLY